MSKDTITSFIPPQTPSGPFDIDKSALISINIPQLGEQPSEQICSYNRCEGCKALYPISGLALVNCPGCNQPTLLVKLSNCPKCNEPTKTIKLRVDHVSDKMPHGAVCKGQLGLADVFFINIEKGAWRDDDQRIKDTKDNQPTGIESKTNSTDQKDPQKLANSKRDRKSGDCGCKKAKTS